MDERSTLFLQQFNRIEKFLKGITGEMNETSFSNLIEKAKSKSIAVKGYERRLKNLAEIRNIIVHSEGQKSLAVPTEVGIQIITLTADMLTKPPTMHSLFNCNVLCLQAGDSIAKALQTMYQNSFSQIPIYNGEQFITLLSTNTITRWLGKNIQEDLISLSETHVETVIQSQEENRNYEFLPRDASIFEALGIFEKSQRQKHMLDAILVTQTGKQNEGLLGICTSWDIPKIYSKIKFE